MKDACEGMYNEFVRNNNKLPYGHVMNLVNELRQRGEWITKNIVNKASIQYRKERTRELRESLETPPPTIPRTICQQSHSVISNLSNTSSTNSHENIGRPVGSTEAKKREKNKS